MIRPDEIRRKAENLYRGRFLRNWLEGKQTFPLIIRSNKEAGDDPSAAIESVRALRAGAKETLGYGYTVEWKAVNSRRHGRNLFPVRILFETREDFLRCIGRQREFAAFAAAVEAIRERYPQLLNWVRSNRKLVIEKADEVEGLLLVIEYLREHPRPRLFARELPLPLDTKFIDRNKHILRDWLDLVLPPAAIHAHEEHFDRRYGLRYAEPHMLVRFLDEDLQRACGSPWPECSIPLHTLAEIRVPGCRALIVENKVNLLTLPPLAQTVALGGLGAGISDLRLVKWLHRAAIWYWGDLDTDGLAILSRLRSIFPQTASLMMDIETFRRYRDVLGQHKDVRSIEPPPGLTATELAAFEACRHECLWIEQEKLPQPQVLGLLDAVFGKVEMQVANSLEC